MYLMNDLQGLMAGEAGRKEPPSHPPPPPGAGAGSIYYLAKPFLAVSRLWKSVKFILANFFFVWFEIQMATKNVSTKKKLTERLYVNVKTTFQTVLEDKRYVREEKCILIKSLPHSS